MTYPASPSDAGTNRVRPDPAQFWAGVAATAVVAALIAVVGILICRWTLNIPILAPQGDGAWGSAHTAEYALVSALVAVIAGGLLYLLTLATPQPNVFFNWILGLGTLAAAVYPFSTSAPLDQKVATAIVNLVLGIAIMTLLTTVAARAAKRPVRQSPYGGASTGNVPGQRYAAEQGQGPGRQYPEDQARTRPVRPAHVSPQDDPRRWE
jgi:Family of unknown function (DUF6069)